MICITRFTIIRAMISLIPRTVEYSKELENGVGTPFSLFCYAVCTINVHFERTGNGPIPHDSAPSNVPLHQASNNLYPQQVGY